MHETALVHQVVDTVLAYAEEVDAQEVKAVCLTVGEGRDVVEEYMQGLFSFLARGTVAEHAKLVVRRVPFTVKCNQCDHVFPIDFFDSSTWKCPQCQAEKDYKLYSGTEFTISHIQFVQNVGLDQAAGDEAVVA